MNREKIKKWAVFLALIAFVIACGWRTFGGGQYWDSTKVLRWVQGRP